MFSKLKHLFSVPETTPPGAAPAPAPTPAPALVPASASASAPRAKEEKAVEKKEEEKKEDLPKKEEPKEALPEPAPAPGHATAPVAVPTPVPAEPARPDDTTQGAAQSEEAPPPPLPPIVYNRYADDTLRDVVKRLRNRTDIYREKVIDPYATSPELSPPVTPVLRKDDYYRKKEEERIKKEEDDKRKAEEVEKRKAEAEKKKEEKKQEEEKKAAEAAALEAANPTKKSLWSYVSCAPVDSLLGPLEDKMDGVLGQTIDPFTVRLVFPYHTPETIPYWILLDVLADLVNVTDIILFQPRLQFVKGGDVIKTRDMTKLHYRETARFQVDLMSIIPFDLLGLQLGFSSFFRLNRLLRIELFFEFSDRLESIMENAYIWRVGRTTGYLLFMLHLNACIYYIASAYQGIGGTKWVYNGQGTAYLRCYYYAVRSLINIGGLPEPHTVFEITFQMTNFFVGVFVFSSLIGQMRDVIGAATASHSYFRASMDGCVSYMNTYSTPKLVQNRVRTWYNYTWDAQGMLDESELLDQMPLVMRTAIAVDINLATFQKIELFKGCDNQMLVDMLLRLKSIIYLPGDFVVKKGDIGKEMYIIKGGEVQVVGGPDNSIVFVTLKSGCVFGEISLLQSAKDGGNRRTANVKAHGFANLFVLEKKDLFDILVHYPESQKVLARKGRKLMKAKGPAAAKTEEDKKKGLTLFGPKPPTPKMLRAFGGFGKGGIMEKIKAAAAEQK